VVEGDTVAALLCAALDVAADLIVMTTHAREGVARALLVLLDGTPRGEAIVQHATALCAVFGAACTLLRVVVPATLIAGIALPDALVDHVTLRAEMAEAETRLGSLVTRHSDGSYPMTSTVVRHGDVPAAVLAYCTEHPAGIIAMTSRGRRGMQRAVLGSVTDALLRDASVPLLVLVSADELW
jgi:nucleotide-binding universal stress UspA family protein